MVKESSIMALYAGQKRVLIDEAMASGRQLVFFNNSKEFELIDTDIRQFINSFDDWTIQQNAKNSIFCTLEEII